MMNGNAIRSSKNLLLATIWAGCVVAFVTAQCGVGTQTNGNNKCSSDDGRANKTIALTCSSQTVDNASVWIARAVSNLNSHFLCLEENNDSLPQDLQMVPEELGQIMMSMISVLVKLGSSPTNTEIIQMFGALDTLTPENLRSVSFVQSWVYIKFLPLAPFITDGFLLDLSRKGFTCLTYQEMIKGLNMKVELLGMELKRSIYSYFINPFLSRPDTSGCVLNILGSITWLEINFGVFAGFAQLGDLRRLNEEFISVEALELLSGTQKGELILDPITGTFENATLVELVLTSVLETQDEQQLDDFFEGFLDAAQESNISYIENEAVRDTILNLTLTALAPRFNLFQARDFALWCQVRLVLVIASFRPAGLLLIPRNISCDSYDAILQGFEEGLARFPPVLQEGIKSSRAYIRQILPADCRFPTGVCQETSIDEGSLCANATRDDFDSTVLTAENYSGTLCNFTITDYACSSVSSVLSSSDVATLLQCKLPDSIGNSKEIWKLFLSNAAEVLADALSEYSMTASNENRPDPQILDVITEVILDTFSSAQLENISVINELFQEKLSPFLPSVSPEFLSCLSTRDFSCETYQVVVDALSGQASLMDEEQKETVFTHFIYPFLSRDDLQYPACVSSNYDNAEWLERNFGNFSIFARLEDLQRLNGNFSGFDSLNQLSPTQAAELTLSPGILNDQYKINIIFVRLEKGDAFLNVDEYFSGLASTPKIPDITPVVRDIMMDRTFTIIRQEFSRFLTLEWTVWFTARLIPILPSFTAEMLTIVTADLSCTNYQVIVRGLGIVFQKMTISRRLEISVVLVDFLKRSASEINVQACRQNIQSDLEWVDINLGPFVTDVEYSELTVLNIRGEDILEILSPEQKAELILDPSTGALENVTIVKEVLTTIVESPDQQKLDDFFEYFVDATKERDIRYVENEDVRNTILNLTLTALAPRFYLFQASDYELWFQVNLVLVLASIRPGNLLLIPKNISCDSYDAILKGLDEGLVRVPPVLQEGIKSSKGYLRQILPADCRFPIGVCQETLIDEYSLCGNATREDVENVLLSENYSEMLCNFSITDYGCSSVSSLSSSDVATLLKCELPDSNRNTKEIWKLFLTNVEEVLADALTEFSMMPMNKSRPDPQILDVITEVILNNFTSAQLENISVINELFQEKLSPFLPSVSPEFLSCLSTRDFSCETYQVVVDVLSGQASLMDEEQKETVFTHFIYPFLSRDDLQYPACVSSNYDNAEWLERNFGNFSIFARLEDLQRLNGNFSGFDSLNQLSPTQAAELTLSPGILNDPYKINIIFVRLEKGDAFLNVDEYFSGLARTPEIPDITPAVRDIMMDRTFTIIKQEFSRFITFEWTVWFTARLIPILPSFTAEMLTIVTADLSCTNYQVIVKGLGIVFHKMSISTRQEITVVLVAYLKTFASEINGPVCRRNIQSDAEWLEINLGPFTTEAEYSDLKELNITGVDVLELLSPSQKAELVLDPRSGALENVTIVKDVFTIILESSDQQRLDDFFEGFVDATEERNITFIVNEDVRDAILNLTLTALAPRFYLFQTRDYELWFQVNLVLLMASFRPGYLLLIPTNISCDSYDAIRKGLDEGLARLPPVLQEGIRSSKAYLRQILPADCRFPLGVCQETLIDEDSLCGNATSEDLETVLLSAGNYSGKLCDFDITDYACSSVSSKLSSSDVATLLQCKLPESIKNTKEIWKLFLSNVAGVLADALTEYSMMAMSKSRPDPRILDIIAEVILNNLSSEQLRDISVIRQWFQKRLRPFLPSSSPEFLSCLSTKDFSCETYQVVVDALNGQASLLDEEKKESVYTNFIYPFLSRVNTPNPGCVSDRFNSDVWLQKNFGKFYIFAILADFRVLNENFSGFDSLDLLTPAQAAELTLSPGTLTNPDQINRIFDQLEKGAAFLNVDEFLTVFASAPESPNIPPAVRDIMMNRTFTIISPQFPRFTTQEWRLWFRVKLRLILPSFTTEMLITVTSSFNCPGNDPMCICSY